MIIISICYPFILILLGILIIKRPPKDVTALYGFRTERAMLNKETWQFANALCGKTILIAGSMMLVLSLIVSGFIIKSGNLNLSLYMLFCESAISLISFISIEKKLRATFDESGHKKTEI